MAKVNWNVVVARVVDIEKLFLKDEQVDSRYWSEYPRLLICNCILKHWFVDSSGYYVLHSPLISKYCCKLG